MIKERFTSINGKRLLIETLQRCYLVKNDKSVAEKLADAGQVLSFETGKIIVNQGEIDNDVYFLLFGEVNVTISGRHIAVRRAYDVFGEMSVITPSEPRAATITAIDSVVVLKVEEQQFSKIADEHSYLWKSIAIVGLDRLRQRDKIIVPPNSTPILFIGCSAESLPIAEKIELRLKHAEIDVMVWNNGVFAPSEITIEELQRVADKVDFALFLFASDDLVVSRNTEYMAPRDNTIFELGLFMGKLGRKRTFILKEHKLDIKIPTDMLGITPITYISKENKDISSVLAPACTELLDIIKKIGIK